MKTQRKSTVGSLPAKRGLALGAVLLAMSACTTYPDNQAAEGIGFREARFQEISAMRDYRQCRDDALELDKQARTAANPGRYRASADLLVKCETGLGPEAANIAIEERMKAYALSVQNYVKAGEIEKAGQNLAKFKESFPGKDLYYADGSSFVETMEILLGQKDNKALAPYANLNVNSTLKNEMRRALYWKTN